VLEFEGLGNEKEEPRRKLGELNEREGSLQ